jgi:hypothetical protein
MLGAVLGFHISYGGERTSTSDEYECDGFVLSQLCPYALSTYSYDSYRTSPSHTYVTTQAVTTKPRRHGDFWLRTSLLLPNAHTTSPLMPDTANPSSSQSQFKTPTSVTLRSSPPPSLYPSYSHPPLHTSLPQPHPPACGMSKLPSIPASPSTNTRALLIYEKGVQGRD